MTDYISKDALIEILADMQGRCNTKSALIHNSKIWKQVKKMPTVDAEPVKHGKWLDMGDFEKCSACHCTHLKEFQSYYGKVKWVKTPYCPYCGAKMDGEAE